MHENGLLVIKVLTAWALYLSSVLLVLLPIVQFIACVLAGVVSILTAIKIIKHWRDKV